MYEIFSDYDDKPEERVGSEGVVLKNVLFGMVMVMIALIVFDVISAFVGLTRESIWEKSREADRQRYKASMYKHSRYNALTQEGVNCERKG